MNIFDIVIVLLIIMSGVIGFKRGFIEEAILLIGTIIIYIIAFQFKGVLGVLLCKYAMFFDFNGLVTINILLYSIIAFIALILVLLVLFKIILKTSNLVQKIVDMCPIFSIPSKILGTIIGLIEGYMLVYALLVILAIPLGNTELFQNSKLNDKIVNKSTFFSKKFGNIKDITNNMIKVEVDENGNYDLNRVNLYIMEKELDYKIVSREEALDIISTGKLDKVQGIKEFVTNYTKK